MAAVHGFPDHLDKPTYSRKINNSDRPELWSGEALAGPGGDDDQYNMT